jgi:hypothetical protein
MNCQMIRVISSPSSSTTGFFTLILAMSHSPDWAGARGSWAPEGLFQEGYRRHLYFRLSRAVL